jgi:hypothetical protein
MLPCICMIPCMLPCMLPHRAALPPEVGVDARPSNQAIMLGHAGACPGRCGLVAVAATSALQTCCCSEAQPRSLLSTLLQPVPLSSAP